MLQLWIKKIDIIFDLVITLVIIFAFSSGVVYFLKNIEKDDSFYLSILLSSLIIESFFIIEQYKTLVKNLKNEK